MQLCENKNCWLKDMEDVPAEELAYWMAYYDLEDKRRKREEARAKLKSKGGRML